MAPRFHRIVDWPVSIVRRVLLKERPAMTKAAMFIMMLGLSFAGADPLRAENAVAPQRGAPANTTVISPIYGQLVRFAMPANFIPAFENTKDAFYIRESVLKGETAKQWSQMITVTGAKGAASNPNFSAQGLAGSIAGGFKKACPESFVVKGLGATKLGDQETFIALAGCGKVNGSADGHSETAMIIAVKGSSDGYTIQWAERAAAQPAVPAIDDAKWRRRLGELMPIRFCPIVPGEAAPYPSCTGN
jgi:hypothetical protein